MNNEPVAIQLQTQCQHFHNMCNVPAKYMTDIMVILLHDKLPLSLHPGKTPLYGSEAYRIPHNTSMTSSNQSDQHSHIADQNSWVPTANHHSIILAEDSQVLHEFHIPVHYTVSLSKCKVNNDRSPFVYTV